jgi:hypothetical protein
MAAKMANVSEMKISISIIASERKSTKKAICGNERENGNMAMANKSVMKEINGETYQSKK